MADYSFNNDASQDERKEVLENDRRADSFKSFAMHLRMKARNLAASRGSM
jgi:hypothetical protein